MTRKKYIHHRTTVRFFLEYQLGMASHCIASHHKMRSSNETNIKIEKFCVSLTFSSAVYLLDSARRFFSIDGSK